MDPYEVFRSVIFVLYLFILIQQLIGTVRWLRGLSPFARKVLFLMLLRVRPSALALELLLLLTLSIVAGTILILNLKLEAG